MTDYTDLQCKCGTAAAAHPRMHADHCDMSRVGAQRAQFEHARALRAEDRLRCAVEALERIANPNFAAQATAADARDMAGFARLKLNEIEVMP